MKKTLIYHLYYGKNFDSNPANVIHFLCLKDYIHIFDEAVFVIAMDDIKDTKSIEPALVWILKLGFSGKLTITTQENTDLYEVETFRNELLNKYNTLDGMVFFAHNKGTTNIIKNGELNMNIARWICGMYFYNMQFIDEVEGFFTGTLRAPEVFYGTFLQSFSKERQSIVHAMPNNISGLEYCGTFYWINMPKYKNCRVMGTIKDVEPDSRFFAEEYPGMFFDRYAYGCGMTSHNDAILDASKYNIYNLTEEDWDEVLDVLGDRDDFAQFSNGIIIQLFAK